jgi:tetratricopeptide (TPR) repeat protein
VGFGRGPAQIGEPVRSVLLRVAFVGAALFSAASFALPWLAARNVEQAASGWRTNPARAFVQLERARGLNPLSDRPDLIAGVIASRIGDLPRMREAFERVLDRNPKNWYAYLELAIVSSLEKDRARALELLGQARALNPSEPVIALVTRKVGAGERISLRVIDRIFLQRLEERTS